MTLAEAAGLLVAFGGLGLLVSPASRALGPPGAMRTRLLEQASLWLLFGAVLAIVLLWEDRSLASLWLRPLRWESFALGVALAALQMYVVFPARVWMMRALRVPDFQAGLEAVLALPVWFRVLAVLGAGVVEETLFGYGLTRLGAAFDSYWLAACVTVPLFALVHAPAWGAGFVLGVLPAAALGTAFFIWTQDLLALILAHIVTDGMGLIVSPPRATDASRAASASARA